MPKFSLEGKVYEYDGKILVKDAMFLHEKTGVGIGRLNYELIVEGNPKVIAAWMFLLKRRAGEAPRWDDVDNWDLATFRPVSDDPKVLVAEKAQLTARISEIDKQLTEVKNESTDETEAAEEAKKADPTRSNRGTPRKRGTTST